MSLVQVTRRLLDRGCGLEGSLNEADLDGDEDLWDEFELEDWERRRMRKAKMRSIVHGFLNGILINKDFLT